jgi:manganese efflux pump family protein
VSFVAIVVLAVGLAMDATAVAGARGLASRNPIRIRDALLVALLFGGFQALMPVLGWALGSALAARIAASWGPWVTFIVLGGIGAKMLHAAFAAGDDVDAKKKDDVFGVKVLALLAIATSIDALAAGLTLALGNMSIALSCAVIGVITAVLSFAGVYVGRHFGARFGKPLEVAGGLVLLGLAVKALADHL